MTQEEAAAHCAELNRDERAERHWFVRESAHDGWEVVSVTGPGLGRPEGLKSSVESKPQPLQPPDPRPTIIRNVPPYGAG